MVEEVYCEQCGMPIAERHGRSWKWTDPGAGVSELSNRELGGTCLEEEANQE